MRILFIEDDFITAQSIQKLLQSEGFICDISDTGEDGVEVGKLYEYDLIILDLMLPDIGGFEVMHRFRMAQVKTPILILSGMDDIANKVKGLCSGADDYLTKPYSKDELIARINAVIRRTHGFSESAIKIGALEVNLHTRIASVDGKVLSLTGKEYAILELLAMRKGAALTKEAFLNHLYGGLDEPELKIIDVFVCKLRKKIYDVTKQNGYIETIWGRGYMLKDPNELSPYVANTDSIVVVGSEFHRKRNHRAKKVDKKQSVAQL